MVTKNLSISYLITIFILFVLCVSSFSQIVTYTPVNITWNDAAPPLPSTIKIAVLEGDPSKEGEFTIRLKVPADWKIAPHWHPAIEHVTVISGSFYLGNGEKFDEMTGTQLPSGSIAIMQPKTPHFAWVKEETIIQLHGIGPWKIVYVNPEDDPANKK